MKRASPFWLHCLSTIMSNSVENEAVETEYFVLVKTISCGVTYETYCAFSSSRKKGSQFGQIKSKAQKQQVTIKEAELNVTEPKCFLLKWKLQQFFPQQACRENCKKIQMFFYQQSPTLTYQLSFIRSSQLLFSCFRVHVLKSCSKVLNGQGFFLNKYILMGYELNEQLEKQILEIYCILQLKI